MVKVTQSTKKRSTRPAPVKRLSVTVKGRAYSVLLHLYDTSAPVMVASASSPGFWKVARESGLFTCTCPGYYHRGHCNHMAAALLADTETAEAAREHRRPTPHMDDAEFEAWVDGLALNGKGSECDYQH